MAGYSRANQSKSTDSEQLRHLKKTESQATQSPVETYEQNQSSLAETPFHPSEGKHIAMLQGAQSSRARNNLVLDLQRTYGNRYVQRVIGSIQEPAHNTERNRALPDELQGKASSGARARTLEETAIDVGGTGSALNSLVHSPGQTIGNAFKGLFSGFPSRSTIRKQAVVQTAINNAWSAAQSDYCERFGWITWDKKNKTYAVPATSVGDPYSCTPPAKPADPAPTAANQVFHVGEFHIHPPLDPSKPDMADPKRWPIGPSKTDERAAQADHSPGIVRDFNSIKRNSGTTDYTYGPWTRTE